MDKIFSLFLFICLFIGGISPLSGDSFQNNELVYDTFGILSKDELIYKQACFSDFIHNQDFSSGKYNHSLPYYSLFIDEPIYTMVYISRDFINYDRRDFISLFDNVTSHDMITVYYHPLSLYVYELYINDTKIIDYDESISYFEEFNNDHTFSYILLALSIFPLLFFIFSLKNSAESIIYPE